MVGYGLHLICRSLPGPHIIVRHPSLYLLADLIDHVTVIVIAGWSLVIWVEACTVVFLIWSKLFLASRLIIKLIDGGVHPLVWNVISSLCHLATTISLKAFGMETAAGSGLVRQLYC